MLVKYLIIQSCEDLLRRIYYIFFVIEREKNFKGLFTSSDRSMTTIPNPYIIDIPTAFVYTFIIMSFIAFTIVILLLLFFASLYGIRVLGKVRLKVSLDRTLKEGSKHDAIEVLLNIIKKKPFDSRSRMELVELYKQEKNYIEAITHLNLMLQFGQKQQKYDPKEVYLHLGECYLAVKNLDEAHRVYNTLRKSCPDESFAYVQLGKIENERGFHDKAIRYLHKALSLDPENIGIKEELGRILFESKKYPEASRVLQDILKKDPENPSAHYHTGKINFIYHQNKEAFAHFLKSKNEDPFVAGSLLHIGMILRQYNKIEDAKKVLASALSKPGLTKNDLLEGMYELAEIYFTQQDIQRAIVLWEKILSSVKEYRDVKSKLDRYAQTRTNSMLRKYLISSRDEFASLCTKIVNILAKQVTIIRTSAGIDSTVEILAQANYKEVPATLFFKFFRGSSNVGELAVREFYEKLRESKAKQGVCITSSDFTEDAVAFSEGRMLELRGNKDLLRMLAQINARG
jgi:tetratricopeptide (TPR) repeat protein